MSTRPKLTVGMATFDDHPGIWFTIQALRQIHREVMRDTEILVVDNNPNSPQGQQTRSFLEGFVHGDVHSTKYVPFGDVVGTSAPRNKVFEEASGDVVLCMDAHVIIHADALRRLIDRGQYVPEDNNLWHGPMTYDDMGTHGNVITHFDPVWRSEMLGIWSVAWQCPCGGHFVVHGGKWEDREIALFFPLTHTMQMGQPISQCPNCGRGFPSGIPYAGHEKELLGLGYSRPADDPNSEPFEIPGMGMGLFACRKEAWLGFNKDARGFGAEEVCIHEKYRQAGRKTLCLPWLWWTHFFGRQGSPYPLNVWNKVRNYVLWFQELGLDSAPIKEHFVASGKMPVHEWDQLIVDPVKVTWPEKKGDCVTCGGGVAQHATLDDLYQRAATVVSDINYHVPKLRELASQCEVVVEFGMRYSVSTVALLAGQPKVFHTHDLNNHPIATGLKRLQGKTDFAFVQGNSLTTEPMECDLLFIDTKHTAAQLWEELRRHAPLCRRWIALHDTATFGDRGEDGSPGLLYAMRQWVREHPEWSVIYHTNENNGFTVLSKNPEDKPKLPSVMKMAWNYAKALANHVTTGQKHADPEVIDSRLNICAMCEQRIEGNRCAACGCFLDQAPDGREGKALWAESECPLAKWLLPAPEVPPVPEEVTEEEVKDE